MSSNTTRREREKQQLIIPHNVWRLWLKIWAVRGVWHWVSKSGRVCQHYRQCNNQIWVGNSGTKCRDQDDWSNWCGCGIVGCDLGWFAMGLCWWWWSGRMMMMMEFAFVSIDYKEKMKPFLCWTTTPIHTKRISQKNVLTVYIYDVSRPVVVLGGVRNCGEGIKGERVEPGLVSHLDDNDPNIGRVSRLSFSSQTVHLARESPNSWF